MTWERLDEELSGLFGTLGALDGREPRYEDGLSLLRSRGLVRRNRRYTREQVRRWWRTSWSRLLKDPARLAWYREKAKRRAAAWYAAHRLDPSFLAERRRRYAAQRAQKPKATP